MMSVMAPLQVFVFSYNRGLFLRNCVRSILANIPNAQVTVVDDNSSDADTQAYLTELSAQVQVIRPTQAEQGRHGGLYANMQLALNHAIAVQQSQPNAQYALFLQDDMQVVRPVNEEDMANITGFFSHYPHAAFLNPLFLKGARQRRDKRITRLAKEFPVYFRHYPQKKNPRGISYADAMIAHVGRLQAANWQFHEGEKVNATQAQQAFGKMGFMLHPFAMFLPEVPVYRGKQKTKAVAKAERRGGTLPKCFSTMRNSEVQALKNRDVKRQLPVAEHYLTTERKVKIPYRYSQINAYPILRIMHKIEQTLR